MTRLDGTDLAASVRTADGEQGWLQDPEEFQYDEEQQACYGYFKEAVFAG